MPEQMKNVDILVVDDSAINRKLAERILGEDYSIASADSGEQALELLEKYVPQLILLDFHMPGMDGAETMAKIRENKEWSSIPIIILTADSAPETEKELFMMGADDFIVKPFVPMTVKSRIGRMMELYGLRRELETKLEEKSKLLEKVSLNSILAIANTIDAKDAYTSGHSVRVAKCSQEIAKRLGWSEEEVRNIYHIGLLHDIGKIGVPDSILNKPSRLSDEEFVQIKKHPVIGGEILKNVRMIPGVADGALYHHERYDGKGYPFGLAGEEIPLCARIIAVADAYDAMTSNRIYRAKLPDLRVVSEFERCSGTQFDPHLAFVFVEMLNEGFHIPPEVRREGDRASSKEQWSIADDNGELLSRILSEYESGKNALDSLTGLHNRGYGEKAIDGLLTEGHKGALMLMDLDDFKSVNDTYGHLMGDKVLKLLGSALSSNVEDKDVACRLGGDEFVAFFTDEVSREELQEKAQRIIEKFSVSLEQISAKDITHISAGIALCPANGKNFSTLYNNADKALYYVKENGKNACSFFRGGQAGLAEKKPGTDLDHIRRILEGKMDESKGLFKVPYEEFGNLYSYLSRCVKRKGQMVQTMLFTLGSDRGDQDNSVYEEAMSTLEVAAAYSLRMVDVGSRYSSLQYIVILVDTNIENGRMVADRVINQFYKIYSGSGITLSYDIQTMVVSA